MKAEYKGVKYDLWSLDDVIADVEEQADFFWDTDYYKSLYKHLKDYKELLDQNDRQKNMGRI